MATKHKVRLNQNAKALIGIVLAIALLAIFLAGLKPAEITTPTPTPTPAPTPTPPAVTPTPPPTVTPNETTTVNYTFPSGIAPPSLKITSLVNTPTFPKVGETTLIRIYVKNVGSDSPATTATLKINSQTVATLDVPAIYQNAQIVLQYNYTAAAKGDYIAEVDVAPVPGEKILDDNFAKITITVM